MDGSDDNYHRVLNLKRHVAEGAYTAASEPFSPTPIPCSTGDCMFPDLVTVGVCSDVADITSLLTTRELPPRNWPNMPNLPSNQTWSAALPDGQNLTIPTLFAFDFFLALDLAPSLTFKHLQKQSFANIYLVYSNVVGLNTSTPRVEFQAVEMVWYWCAKAYSLNVTRGVTHATLLSASSTILQDTTTAPVNMPQNLNFILCIFDLTPSGKKCEDHTWGDLILAAPPGFEATHPPLVVNELASLSLSSFLTMSFWNGVKSPLELAAQSEAEIGAESEGMFRAFARQLYRVQGDLSLAFAINLYRDYVGGVDPGAQVGILTNLTRNVAGGVENL